MDGSVLPPGRLEKSHMDAVLRVMIVDDHEVFRLGLRDLLDAIDGFRVVAQANCCKDALAQIEAHPVDLVLLDLYLPDAEGINAVHQLRKAVPQLPVILLSATMDDDLLLGAVLAGVSGYLTKDTPAIDIVRVLERYRRGELAMLPAVIARAVNLLVQHNNLLKGELTLSQQNELKKPDEHNTEVGASAMTSSIQSSNSSLQLLTPQEEKIYQLMRRGLSNKKIAAQLFISHFTVGKHVQNILRKLGAINRTQAVTYTSFEGDGEL
ncbi:MAG TPA: response regulator transcription factor [Ktedonobacteraceae bacterium]|nr:response regulator transcription factor [Ktedonobacteraceae bacterium]